MDGFVSWGPVYVEPTECRLMTLRPAALFPFLASIAFGLIVAACAGDPGTSPPEPDPRLYGLPTAADPWGHYIRAASDRFYVPEGYVRTVMQIESGGRTTLHGQPITSHAGAMGLMQIMPATSRESRRKKARRRRVTGKGVYGRGSL